MIFLVPYAYDYIDTQKGSGYGSIARCEAALEKWRQLGKPKSSIFVLTAGYSSKSPEEPTEEHPISLGQQMGRYIRTQEPEVRTDTSAWKSWGTHAETHYSIQLMEFHLRRAQFQPVEVWVVSNTGHLPRVWLCWQFLKPRGWKVHFISAPHSFSTKNYCKEWWQEFGKFFLYLFRFLFKKW